MKGASRVWGGAEPFWAAVEGVGEGWWEGRGVGAGAGARGLEFSSADSRWVMGLSHFSRNALRLARKGSEGGDVDEVVGWLVEGEGVASLWALQEARGVLEMSVGLEGVEGRLLDMSTLASLSEASVRLRLPSIELWQRGVGERGDLPLVFALERRCAVLRAATLSASREALAVSSSMRFSRHWSTLA
jgi:hypothetical protein